MSHPERAREPALDWMRGFAALAVVCFHYMHKGPQEGWMHATRQPVLADVAIYGYLGVHLFFIISGYVILMSAQAADWRQFAASRFARLAPALWFCVLFTSVVEMLIPQAPFKPEGWWQIVANLTLIPSAFGQSAIDGAYWSLAVEIKFYLGIGLILAFGQLRRIELFLMIWLAISLVNFVRPMYPVQRFLLAEWAPLFSAGAWFYLVRESGWTKWRRLSMGVSLALACGYAWREAGGTADLNDLFLVNSQPNTLIVLALIVAFYAVFGACALRPTRRSSSAIGIWMGTVTYPLYLVHQNAGYAAFNLAVAGGLTAVLGDLPVVLGLIGLALVVASLVHIGIERRLGSRLRRWIGGRSHPLGKAGPAAGSSAGRQNH